MSRTIKLLISIVVGICIFCAVSYSFREYWLGSFIIYAVSSAEDRNNLTAKPEKYELIKTQTEQCVAHTAYGYKMCLPWDDVQYQNTDDLISLIKFDRKAAIVIYNPDIEGNLRSDLIENFFEYDSNKAFSSFKLNNKYFEDFKSIADTTLEANSYTFFEKTLNSTFENYSFFTNFKEVYPQMMLLMSKIRVCRLSPGIYSDKILSFHINKLKGFQINFPEKNEISFHYLYIFPNDNENIKLTVVGGKNIIRQNDIDLLIKSIVKLK